MNTIISFLQSERFYTFIGHIGAIGAIAALNTLAASINIFNLPPVAVTLIGLGVAQAVGALTDYVKGNPTGLTATKTS